MPRFDDDEEDDRRPRRRRPRQDDDEDDRRESSRPPKKSATPLILGLLGGLFVICAGCGVGGYFLVWKPAKKAVDDVAKNLNNAGDEMTSQNNMKQIGIGMQNHADRENFFPHNSYDANGKPLLSWRVHLLPYIDQKPLYDRFNLNEPWDGPTNRPLLSQMPATYGTPEMRRRAGDGKTYYQGFSHTGALFAKLRPGTKRPDRLTVSGIPDGLSNTLFVVEAGTAVEWTKPEDIDFGPGKPLPSFGAGRDSPIVLVLMGDSSVRRVKKSSPDSTWRALISIAGGEVVPFDEP